VVYVEVEIVVYVKKFYNIFMVEQVVLEVVLRMLYIIYIIQERKYIKERRGSISGI